MITVEIWSDFLCPFCYIGKRRFESALAAFPQRDQVEVSWRSFELDPNARRDPNISVYELLAKKYGRTVEWARDMNANLEAQALQLGLTFHMDQIIPTNSFDAHRLLQLAKSLGQENAISEKLFAAYFTEGRHIGRVETLVGLAEEAGLDRSKVQTVLNTQEFGDAVRRDEDAAQLYGLTGVPAFVLNRRYLISGAQSSEVFLQSLQKLLEESA